MKKYYTVLVMVCINTELFGNELLNRIENSANFHTPVKTIESVINSKNNITEIKKYVIPNKHIEHEVHKRISNIKKVDFSKIQQSKTCIYQDQKKQIIKGVFQKYQDKWVNISIVNSKNQKIKNLAKGIINKSYKLPDSESCFIDFRDNWEKVYKGASLELKGETSQVTNVLVKKGNIVYNAIFTLKYIHPTHNQYHSGWLISSMKLKETENKIVNNKPIPKSEEAFFIGEKNRHNPNIVLVPVAGKRGLMIKSKNDMPKVLDLSCNKTVDKIRVSFVLNKNVSIGSVVKKQHSNKLIGYAVNSIHSKKKYGNCSFLQLLNKNNLSYIDLTNFKKEVDVLEYGIGARADISFIDFYFQREVSLLDNVTDTLWGGH